MTKIRNNQQLRLIGKEIWMKGLMKKCKICDQLKKIYLQRRKINLRFMMEKLVGVNRDCT